jgi:hypothetical protein
MFSYAAKNRNVLHVSRIVLTWLTRLILRQMVRGHGSETGGDDEIFIGTSMAGARFMQKFHSVSSEGKGFNTPMGSENVQFGVWLL